MNTERSHHYPLRRREVVAKLLAGGAREAGIHSLRHLGVGLDQQDLAVLRTGSDVGSV